MLQVWLRDEPSFVIALLRLWVRYRYCGGLLALAGNETDEDSEEEESGDHSLIKAFCLYSHQQISQSTKSTPQRSMTGVQ